MGNQRFSITPAKAAVDLELTDSIFRTLAVIGIHGDENGWCWPKQSTLARLRGVSRQTISSHIKTLIKFGYLNITHQFDEETGAQESNLMQIRFDYGNDFTGGVKPKTLQGVLTPGFTHNAPSNGKKGFAPKSSPSGKKDVITR